MLHAETKAGLPERSKTSIPVGEVRRRIPFDPAGDHATEPFFWALNEANTTPPEGWTSS